MSDRYQLEKHAERLIHTRRQLIKRFGVAAGVFVAAPLIGRAAFAQQTPVTFSEEPYKLGIASGDADATGFVLWTRLAPKPFEIGFGMETRVVEVEWEVASDESFASIVQSGKAIASPFLAHTVHVEVKGLQPSRVYWYRFRAGGQQSPVGKAKTTPAAGAKLERIKFAVAGCQNWEAGFYTAYKHLIAEEPEVLYCYGDYIYEGGGRPAADPSSPLAGRRHLPGEIYSVDDYRRRYALYKSDANLRAAHQACVWYPVWDDHETENNWASEWDENGSPPELFRFRRAAAAQAYYEHMPLRATSLPNGTSIQIYRRTAFGDLIDMSLLDTRQFRSNQPCNDKAAGCTDLSSAKEFMGRPQEQWLFNNLKASKAKWNVIAQQVMMMDLDRDPGPDFRANIDSWAGYRTPRTRTLQGIQASGAKNVVVLTGDEHVNYAGELHIDGRKPGKTPIGLEFVSTSITSAGDGQDASETAKGLLTANEELKFINQQRGYVICDVTPQRWESTFRVLEKVSQPDMPIKTRIKMVIETGSNRMTAA